MEKYDVEVDEYGTICFYKPGTEELHRLDGHAVESPNGTKFWYVDGKRHRLDGPAVEWANRDKSWYIDGVELTEYQFKEKTAPVKELTVAEIEKLLGYKVKVID